MKTQMIIGGILFGVAACTAPADGYRITGNIEGAGDGKAILLQSAGFGEPTMGDTVNMRNGKFVFEGRLESPVSVTVKVCPDSDQPASLGFIAENSPIRVMAAWKDVIERYGYRSIGGQTVEGSLNQEVYEKIAGVYGQILKAPEHKEYAEAQQKMAGLRNTDTEAYYKLQDETEPLSERFSEAVRQRQLELIREMAPEGREEIAIRERVRPGQPAPDFSLETPDGSRLALSDLRGKYVLLDFWASWCRPCRASFPEMKKIYARFKDKGFEILGVTNDSRREDWLKALEQDQLPWKQVIDEFPEPYKPARVITMYAAPYLPTLILIGPDGKIIGQAKDKHQLVEWLEERL